MHAVHTRFPQSPTQRPQASDGLPAIGKHNILGVEDRERKRARERGRKKERKKEKKRDRGGERERERERERESHYF